MNQKTDAIIIGCGIIGNCIAYELARKGYNTLSVDRLGGSGFGSTSGSCAIIRLYYSSPEGVALAREGGVGVIHRNFSLEGQVAQVDDVAVGIAEGLHLGINSKSALITRGLAEITRLATACGAHRETLAGLAGMGDLVLTCNGLLSRNLQVGIRLGKGETLKEILDSMKMVAEGVATAHSTLALAKQHDIEMPITQIVVDILNEKITPVDAVMALMGRRLRTEKE